MDPTQLLMGHDPNLELEIINGIVLREDYIKRLYEMANAKSSNLMKMIDLLDMQRGVALDIAEGIAKWQEGLVRNCFVQHSCL